MTRHAKQTSMPDAAIRRAANALKRAGNTREAKRLERTLPADNPKGDKR